MFTQVIFDLDGTLVDSTEAILDAFRAGFNLPEIVSRGIKYPGDQELEKHFGKGLSEIIEIFSIPKNLQNQFKNAFIENELKSLKFYYFSGIEDIIKFLKINDIKIVIVTSKGLKTAKYVLDFLKLDPDILVTSDDVLRTKPNPEPLVNAINQLNIEISPEIAYIGDSIHDIQAAINCGITPIGVKWGAHGEEMEDNFYKTFSTPIELLNYLKNTFIS